MFANFGEGKDPQSTLDATEEAKIALGPQHSPHCSIVWVKTGPGSISSHCASGVDGA